MKTSRAQRNVGDARQFDDSDLFLDNKFVDSFKDEVRRPTQATVKVDDEEAIIGNDEGYITEPGDQLLESCASNWKAAASTEKKRMWGVFEETGIFACACPHGFVLWLADMIQSGELCV